MSLQAHYSPVAQAMEQNPAAPQLDHAAARPHQPGLRLPRFRQLPLRRVGRDNRRPSWPTTTPKPSNTAPSPAPNPCAASWPSGVSTTEGLDVGPDNIMITSGASQGIALAARLLVPPGGTVIVESPTFIGALWFFRGLGINVVGVGHRRPGHRPRRAARNGHPPAPKAGAPRLPRLHHAHRPTTPSASTPRVERRQAAGRGRRGA